MGAPTKRKCKTNRAQTPIARSPFWLKRHLWFTGGVEPVKKTLIKARNIMGIAGLLVAGYLILSSVPDLGRYIRISKM